MDEVAPTYSLGRSGFESHICDFYQKDFFVAYSEAPAQEHANRRFTTQPGRNARIELAAPIIAILEVIQADSSAPGDQTATERRNFNRVWDARGHMMAEVEPDTTMFMKSAGLRCTAGVAYSF